MIAEAARQRAELEGLARQLANLPLEQIRELSGLGPWSVGAARTLHDWSGRFPRFARGVKSLARFWQSSLSGLFRAGGAKRMDREGPQDERRLTIFDSQASEPDSRPEAVEIVGPAQDDRKRRAA
jgi:hypothetical protein